MSRGDNLTRLHAIFLALGLTTASAQGAPLDALYAWLNHTEEAAKYLDKGNYAKAEERLKMAIKVVRPYLPDTRRNMARSYCELARVLYHEKRYADAEPLARWTLSKDSDS